MVPRLHEGREEANGGRSNSLKGERLRAREGQGGSGREGREGGAEYSDGLQARSNGLQLNGERERERQVEGLQSLLKPPRSSGWCMEIPESPLFAANYS